MLQSKRATVSSASVLAPCFCAAGGFDVGHWRNKSIVVAFENIQEREGQSVRLIRSVMITPDFTGSEVVLTDMYTQQEVMVRRVEPGN